MLKNYQIKIKGEIMQDRINEILNYTTEKLESVKQSYLASSQKRAHIQDRLAQLEAIKNSKEKLLNLLSNKVEANIITNGKHHIRELRNLNPSGEKATVCKYANEPFSDKKIISVL